MSAEGVVALREEHKGIVQRLAIIERCVNAPGFNEKKFRESVATLGVQLREHFKHEERVVYEPLNSRLKGSSPTKELIEEHGSIWKAFDKLGETNLTKNARVISSAQLKVNLSSLQLALGKHLKKEERLVFWLADCLL
ncbi:MAG TPA: hemerythrin domain-containing protein [Candidatus Acidoferrales bacterium]|nr:hemerythrin domain-containing protein [Candidatus Acidoferrales bacterium]